MAKEEYIVAIQCIIEYEGKFLLIKRPIGSYGEGDLSFVGGGVEVTDSESEDILYGALDREIFEEVGLKIEDPYVYVTTNFFMDGERKIINNVFYCKLEKTIPNIIPSPREVPEYYFMSYDEVMTHDNSPIWIRTYLKKAINLLKRDFA